MVGESDQIITIVNDSLITGTMKFISDITVPAYQWYYNDTTLNSGAFDGETSENLTWNVDVDSGWMGTFNCQTGNGISRDIIVTDQIICSPQDVTFSIIGDNIYLEWIEIVHATSYNVYSSTDSNESFENWTLIASEIPVNNWSEPTELRKFYYVTANYTVRR